MATHTHPKMPWVHYINAIPDTHTAILEGKNPAPASTPRESEDKDSVATATPTSHASNPFEGWAFDSAMVKIDGLIHHNFTAAHVAAATGNMAILKAAMDESIPIVADIAVTHQKFTLVMAAARGATGDAATQVLELLLTADPDTKLEKRLRGHDKHGMTPLMHAAAAGNLAGVEHLILRGAKVDAHDKLGRTVVMHGALSGNNELVKMLIANGAELKHRQPGTGRPVSMFAAQMGGMAVVRMLSENEAVPIDDRDDHGATVAMLAAKSGNQDLFNFIASNITLTCLEAKDNDDRDVLFYAAQGGNEVIIERILKEEVMHKSVRRKDKHGVTVAMLAARTGKIGALEALMRHGALVTDVDEHHRSVVMYAAESGSGEVMRALLKSGVKLGTEKHKTTGSTLAMYAAQSNSHDLLDLLSDHGADLTDKDDQHLTVAMHAANSGSVEVMEQFIKKGLGLDGVDCCNRTVAMHAVHSGSTALVELLIKHKVDLSGADKFGWNIPITAARSGNYKMVKLVIEAMAADELLDHHDIDGRNIVSHAAEAGSVNALTTLAAHKAPFFALDNDGRCHLSHAAEHGCTSAARYLLSRKLPTDKAAESNGFLPVHYAAQHGCRETVETLLNVSAEAGKALEARTKDQRTLLMLAAESGSADLIELLLELGANKEAVDAHKKSAKDYAEGQACKACIKLLA